MLQSADAIVCRVSSGPRHVVTTSEHIIWTDDDEAAVYVMSKMTSSQLRAMKTGRQRLAALTVALPTSSVDGRMSSLDYQNL